MHSTSRELKYSCYEPSPPHASEDMEKFFSPGRKRGAGIPFHAHVVAEAANILAAGPYALDLDSKG